MSSNVAQSDPAEGSREVVESELARQQPRGGAAQRQVALTSADIIAVIRDADDHLVAALLNTGATLAEFTEAVSWLSDDQAARKAGRSPPSGRAGRVLDLLKELDAARAGGREDR